MVFFQETADNYNTFTIHCKLQCKPQSKMQWATFTIQLLKLLNRCCYYYFGFTIILGIREIDFYLVLGNVEWESLCNSIKTFFRFQLGYIIKPQQLYTLNIDVNTELITEYLT